MDDKFFNSYIETFKTAPGIPNDFQMNAPMATNVLVGTIGLELEMEGRPLPREGHLETVRGEETKAGWSAVTDGSLRGEAREFILTTPCTVKELPTLLNGLWDAFKVIGTKLNNSNRCSTHVHINVSGKTVNQLTSVIILWGTFEEALINWCGEERIRNHHALSTKDASSTIDAWDKLLRTGSTNQFGRELKYSALNVLPIWDKGSVEFRCGPASNDPVMPVKWATFINGFVEYATAKYLNPEDIAYDLSERGGHMMFLDICKSCSSEIFGEEVLKSYDRDQFDRLAMDGFRTVQRLALGYPWGDWLPVINRPFVPNPFAKPKKKTYLRDPGLAPPRRAHVLEPDEEFDDMPEPQGEAPAPVRMARPWDAEPDEWVEAPPQRPIGVGSRVMYTGRAEHVRPRGTLGTAIRPQGEVGWFVQWDHDGRADSWTEMRNLRVV